MCALSGLCRLVPHTVGFHVTDTVVRSRYSILLEGGANGARDSRVSGRGLVQSWRVDHQPLVVRWTASLENALPRSSADRLVALGRDVHALP